MPVLSCFRFMLLLAIVVPSYSYAQDNPPIIVDDFIDGNLTTPDVEELSGFADVQFDTSRAEDEEDSDDFFDANDLVPQGEMGRKGPINVDPVTQPASRFIIVRKNSGADTRSARLVSAERAMSLGRFDSALLMFEELYEVNKKDPRVLMGRAVSLQKVGRFDEAMQTYDALSKVEPDNIDVKVNMLGLLATRYPSIALRRLLDLREANKSSVALTAQIAVTYAKTGDARSALRYLGIAASMDSKNANHVFNMAVIADGAGDEEKAVSYYEKALELDSVYGAGRSIPRDVVYERLAQIR